VSARAARGSAPHRSIRRRRGSRFSRGFAERGRAGGGLSARAASRLKPRLDSLLAATDASGRIPSDPVEFPKGYSRPEDIELVALIAACLSYGRADVFKPKIRLLLSRLGEHPSELAQRFDVRKDAGAFEGFVYRFNRGTDLAVLVSAAGRLQREHGTIGRAFASEFERTGGLRPALAFLVRALRGGIDPEVVRRLGRPGDLGHLLPDPMGGSACKRLLLFLRWMIRGPDAVDFGLWRIPPAALVIPLDTHVGRLARFLGLTSRRDLSFRTAEQVTASLARMDPEDPVKYDFALCHFGMSGRCPTRSSAATCSACPLLDVCRAGPRVLRGAGRCARLGEDVRGSVVSVAMVAPHKPE
jgi:uncharacterized protein (TIGR02757 family)